MRLMFDCCDDNSANVFVEPSQIQTTNLPTRGTSRDRQDRWQPSRPRTRWDRPRSAQGLSLPPFLQLATSASPCITAQHSTQVLHNRLESPYSKTGNPMLHPLHVRNKSMPGTRAIFRCTNMQLCSHGAQTRQSMSARVKIGVLLTCAEEVAFQKTPLEHLTTWCLTT